MTQRTQSLDIRRAPEAGGSFYPDVDTVIAHQSLDLKTEAAVCHFERRRRSLPTGFYECPAALIFALLPENRSRLLIDAPHVIPTFNSCARCSPRWLATALGANHSQIYEGENSYA
jgi:hypothetical protein